MAKTAPERLVTPERHEDDSLEASLRPKRLADFVGQKQARENLSIFIQAAKTRQEALDHVLFSGPPGLGKTTLAQIVARELAVGFRATSGPVIQRAGDLAALLTNLQPRDILFIDEIHRLQPVVEESLYPAMEDFRIELVTGFPEVYEASLDHRRFSSQQGATPVQYDLDIYKNFYSPFFPQLPANVDWVQNMKESGLFLGGTLEQARTQFQQEFTKCPSEYLTLIWHYAQQPKDEVIFETGYGPSGLPHIGTFGEVARTTMVRHAFRVLTDDKVKTRLIAFSDDMDGLRKVPDNVPNKELLSRHLGQPLTRVPDPFGTHPSFGAHNNARLRAFLDTFGFDYEFLSSTDCYTSGRFDAALMTVLARFDKVMAIMLPSLREERAQTYSPFLPISPRTGVVLQVPIVAHDAQAGTITYDDPDTGERVETPVTGGRCKLQWKPDWAMRWVALGIDYEMAGKDLIDSVKLSGKICSALGGLPPEGFNYELFLDDKGQKISKSKGTGLTIDEWLRYGSPESLSLFMYREPKSAKRLYFDVIPRQVDDYQQFLEAYPRQDGRQQLANLLGKIPAYAVANLHASYQINKTLQIYGLIQNALNTRYKTFGILGDPTGVPFLNLTNPREYTLGPPLGFYAGIKASF